MLLAAEWGHPERLLKLLDRSDTPQARKVKIISLLGEMQADEASSKLKEVLKDRDLAKQAIGAMGNLGREGIPLLVDIMNTSPQLELQAAAAKGLGQLGRTARRCVCRGAVARQAGRSEDRLVRAYGSGLVTGQDSG